LTAARIAEGIPFDHLVANAVIAPVSAQGEVCFYSQSPTHLLADVNGWFAN
jgi:hypothetical protein